jgi:hypothetical protein
MTLRNEARTPPSPLTEQDLADGFLRLVANEWRTRDAQPFARRVRSAPSVAAPFLVRRLVEGGDREREVATGLLGLLEGPRVISPLQEVLRNQTVSVVSRAAAASVLETLGYPPAQPIDLVDPISLLVETWDSVFRNARAEPSFVEQFVGCLEDDDAPTRGEIIHTLAEPRDARALPLLLPLLYSKRGTTITHAIEAIESIGDGGTIAVLQEIAKGDPHQRVRQRARAAYGRLMMRTGADEFRGPPPSISSASEGLPVHRTAVSLIDRLGDQAVFVSRRRHDGLLKVITVLTSDTKGIKDSYGVDMMREEEFDQIVAETSRHGLPPVEVDLTYCREVVSEARRLNIETRRRPPMDLQIWRGLLDDPPNSQPRQLGLRLDDEHDLSASIAETGRLLTTPEFRQWYFDAQLVWPFVDEWYSGSIHQQNGETGQQVLDQLVEAAITDLFDNDHRVLLSRRLSRQAHLLERLGKGELSFLATAAAQGLDPHRGIPLSVHPFVRAMVLSSFFNAGLRPPQPRLFPED